MMRYIDALHLLEACVEHQVLCQDKDGYILIIHEKGPVLWDKCLLAQELMQDKEGQSVLRAALSEKGVNF